MDVLHERRSLDVLRSFVAGDYDSKEQFDLKARANELLLSRGFERLISLDSLPVRLFDHQKTAVLQVLRAMRGRAVLADEVGLGKTIEAGVVLKEYLLRGLCRRVLILVPASLVSQWQDEMREKMGLEFSVARQGVAFRKDLVLASIDTAKRSENAEIIHACHWDMVIVDEAHRLKNKRTINWHFVDRIQKKYLLLLTATPVQNDLRELYNLITLLQPGQLSTYSDFKRDFVEDRHSPKNTGRLRALLSEVMVRRSRRDTLIRFPKREVRSLSVPLSEPEQSFYNRMIQVLGQAYRAQPNGKRNLLPFLLLLRETCSHPKAAYRTLEKMAQSEKQAVLPKAALKELIELYPEGKSAKQAFALDFLRKVDEPVIVFTEFRASQAALMAECRAADLLATEFHGGLSRNEKDAAVERFRKKGGVLVSTESGGEGRNLQFCRTVLNYDLPWNPMRVEQRIGRVHRLGQVNDVLIVNMATEGTVESYILYLLDRKIRMFQKVVGELETVLATLENPYERVLAHIVLESSDQAEMAERMEAFGAELEAACASYENMRRLNARLFGEPEEMGLEA